MQGFKYKEEFYDDALPNYKRATVDKNIFALLTVFMFECLIRTKGSRDGKLIFRTFDEKLNDWKNEIGKKAFRDFLKTCAELETLNSRFMEFKRSLEGLYGYFEEFMRNSLGIMNQNFSNRVVVKKAAQTFRVYMKLRDSLSPDEYLGSKVIGYFGVIERSLCLYYTQEMLIIDKSTIKRIKTHMLPFYYDPRNQSSMSYMSIIECKIDREIHLSSSKRNESDDSPILIEERLICEDENSSCIESSCSSHPSGIYIKSTCGVSHCVMCLFDSMKSNGLCSCLIVISHKTKQEVLEIMKNQEISPSSSNKITDIKENKKPPCQKHPDCANINSEFGLKALDHSSENSDQNPFKCNYSAIEDPSINCN